MIVKKIPILQGFPAPDTVNYLSNVKNELSENSAIFYDIETTGLSRYTASVYLIGAVRYEKNQWILYQWMAENAEEEASVLQEFSVFLENAGYTIQYNGNRFDQQFGNTRKLLEQLIGSDADILICTKSDLVVRDIDL